MKRSEMMRDCPEDFEDKLKEIIDYFEDKLNDIEKLLDINDVFDLGQIVHARDLVQDIAQDIY